MLFRSGKLGGTEFIKITNRIPLKQANEIKALIQQHLKLIWEIALKLLIEGLKLEKETPINKLKMAAYIIRLSSTTYNEQYEFDYIKEGLSILKSIEYNLIDASEAKDVLDILGNAFDIYTEKWESAIENEMKTLLSIINSKNPEIYIILNKHIKKRKPLILFRGFTKNFTKNLASDILFLKLLKEINVILISMIQGESQLTNSIKKGKEILKNFREALDFIDKITGLPKGIVIVNENNEWKVKPYIILSKANDEFNECSNTMHAMETIFKNLENNVTVTENYNVTNYNTIIETWQTSARERSRVYHDPIKMEIKAVITSNLKCYYRENYSKLYMRSGNQSIREIFCSRTRCY